MVASSRSKSGTAPPGSFRTLLLNAAPSALARASADCPAVPREMVREVSERRRDRGNRAPRPRGGGRFAMARHAQRLEIFQVVQAAQGAVRPKRGLEVVDLEAVRRFAGPPDPHSGLVRSLAGEANARGPFRGHVPTAAAAVLIAPLGCAPGLRPPVVVPKGVAAGIAAPGPPPRGQDGPAPRAAARPRPREGADRQQRGALRRRYRNAGSRSASSCGELTPARNSGSAPIENCMPVQNRPNSPKRDDASSNRISYTSFLNTSGSSA
jgi:hypothetical protein